jgi:hypothetical protein
MFSLFAAPSTPLKLLTDPERTDSPRLLWNTDAVCSSKAAFKILKAMSTKKVVFWVVNSQPSTRRYKPEDSHLPPKCWYLPTNPQEVTIKRPASISDHSFCQESNRWHLAHAYWAYICTSISSVIILRRLLSIQHKDTALYSGTASHSGSMNPSGIPSTARYSLLYPVYEVSTVTWNASDFSSKQARNCIRITLFCKLQNLRHIYTECCMGNIYFPRILQYHYSSRFC